MWWGPRPLERQLLTPVSRLATALNLPKLSTMSRRSSMRDGSLRAASAAAPLTAALPAPVAAGVGRLTSSSSPSRSSPPRALQRIHFNFLFEGIAVPKAGGSARSCRGLGRDPPLQDVPLAPSRSLVHGGGYRRTSAADVNPFEALCAGAAQEEFLADFGFVDEVPSKSVQFFGGMAAAVRGLPPDALHGRPLHRDSRHGTPAVAPHRGTLRSPSPVTSDLKVVPTISLEESDWPRLQGEARGAKVSGAPQVVLAGHAWRAARKAARDSSAAMQRTHAEGELPAGAPSLSLDSKFEKDEDPPKKKTAGLSFGVPSIVKVAAELNLCPLVPSDSSPDTCLRKGVLHDAGMAPAATGATVGVDVMDYSADKDLLQNSLEDAAASLSTGAPRETAGCPVVGGPTREHVPQRHLDSTNLLPPRTGPSRPNGRENVFHGKVIPVGKSILAAPFHRLHPAGAPAAGASADKKNVQKTPKPDKTAGGPSFRSLFSVKLAANSPYSLGFSPPLSEGGKVTVLSTPFVGYLDYEGVNLAAPLDAPVLHQYSSFLEKCYRWRSKSCSFR